MKKLVLISVIGKSTSRFSSLFKLFVLSRSPMILTEVILLTVLSCGCFNKNSAAEGVVVDSGGKPIKNISIVAEQIDALKGYERVEATTDIDGKFRIKGLFPTSEYILKPRFGSFEIPIVFKSAPKGETVLLPSPMELVPSSSKLRAKKVHVPAGVPRFTMSPEGVINDNGTGLKWIVGPQEDVSYEQAEEWIATCRILGGGWRMPYRGELASLREEGLNIRNLDPVFDMRGLWVWAEPYDNSSAWEYSMALGEDSHSLHRYSTLKRAMGVRLDSYANYEGNPITLKQGDKSVIYAMSYAYTSNPLLVWRFVSMGDYWVANCRPEHFERSGSLIVPEDSVFVTISPRGEHHAKIWVSDLHEPYKPISNVVNLDVITDGIGAKPFEVISTWEYRFVDATGEDVVVRGSFSAGCNADKSIWLFKGETEDGLLLGGTSYADRQYVGLYKELTTTEEWTKIDEGGTRLFDGAISFIEAQCRTEDGLLLEVIGRPPLPEVERPAPEAADTQGVTSE